MMAVLLFLPVWTQRISHRPVTAEIRVQLPVGAFFEKTSKSLEIMQICISPIAIMIA